MTDFDFMVEVRIDGVSDVYVNYNGDVSVEYDDYVSWDMREIDFTIDELRAILAAAEAQEAKFKIFKAENT